jgi:hypothetical protein
MVDRNGLLVQARWGDTGNLVIVGQDLGDLPWGVSEYEYGITVPSDAVPLVIAALGGDAGDDVLALLAEQGEAIVARGELAWLKEIGAEPEFWSRFE